MSPDAPLAESGVEYVVSIHAMRELRCLDLVLAQTDLRRGLRLRESLFVDARR